jgi:hypothetical protein
MTMTFERIILDEWIFIPFVLTVLLWAFGLGFLVGTILVL